MMRTEWKEYAEIKRRLPSVSLTVFEVPTKELDALDWSVIGAAVNAAEFEGHAPGTVFFGHTERVQDQGVTRLFFVHRPEGWGRDSQQVVAVNAPADFAPLAALRIRPAPPPPEHQATGPG